MESTSYIINIVDRILRYWGVRVEKENIKTILCSDPSFPSIKALYDTFAYYGLKANVYQAEFEHIQNTPYCVIHSSIDDGHFYCVKRISENRVHLYDGVDKLVSEEIFQNIWDGVVLLVEGKETGRRWIGMFCKTYLILFLMAILFLITIPMLSNSFNSIVQLILDVIGLSISYLMFSQSLYAYKNLPFCHIGKRFDCSFVSKANPLKRIIPFGLPVIGMGFFIFDWLLLLTGDNQNLYVLFIYCVAVVCMFLLVVYQLVVVRKYCLYCMCISALAFVKPFFVNDGGNNMISFLHVLSAGIFSVIAVAIIYGYGEKVKAEMDSSLKLMSFKRIPHMFNMLLSRNSPQNVLIDHALVFGNESSQITIDTIINLKCSHCRKVVKEVCSLIEKWPTLICWRVYIDGIYVKSSNEMDNSWQLHIISQYIENHDMAFQNLKEWKFNVNNNPVSAEAKERYSNLVADIRQMGIDHYPTILFNNHQFPREYDISDVGILINDWIHSVNSKL